MEYCDIKFLLNFDEYEFSSLDDVLKSSKSFLNWKFDENFNAYNSDEEIDYEITDVSGLENKAVENIKSSFFSSAFYNVIDIPLYKFLVLKNNKKLTLLANISSLIFDYTSINDFYQLFYKQNKSHKYNDLNSYYSSINDYLNSPDFDNDSHYWQKQITDSSSYLKFYKLNKSNYKSRIITIPEDSVISYTDSHECSVFDFYASIFSLYLSYVDRLEGCFIKTVNPRSKSGSDIFDKNIILKIHTDNEFSFDELLDEFNLSFNNALSHTKVNTDNYLDEDVYYSVYDFSNFNENIEVYNGDGSALTLNIYENSIKLVYNADLFSDIYIEHMVKNIESLINEVLNSHDKPLSEIDVLSDEEKTLLSDYCRGMTADVNDEDFFSVIFRKHALNNPEAMAVDDGDTQISYGELEKSTNSIAYDLKENYNICKGSRVALILPRNYHFPQLAISLNKIGAAFIPVDPIYPLKRIKHMLEIADADYIITTEEFKDLYDFKIDTICIEELNDDDDVDLKITCDAEDLFFIAFTSGTTGIPKGVMIKNSQYPGLCVSFKNTFNFSYGDVSGCYLSFSFIASCLVYVTFFMGGCCRIFNEKEQKDSLALVKTLKETHMNNIFLPPSVGIPIFENEDINLDYLVFAGAKLNELTKKDTHTQIINFYGTTEIVFGVTKVYNLNDIKPDRVPIGRPVSNTWVYILDKNNRQMPIGVPGEICVSSKYISPGYVNDPEMTKEVFVANPYSTCKDNEIMYRTGDIGFYNFDGEIEIIGREDDQLSVRGFRIEYGEILNVIDNFDEITDVYIDVEKDNLIAYYTSEDDFDIEKLKEELKNELPYYMLPSLFIKLDKIPLNLNGKIDKSALKTVLNHEDIEIADEILASVVDAFKEVLNADYVLIDDDFVSMGGNSLSAMKLQLLLKEKFAIHFSSNELIALSTPQEISDNIKFNLGVHTSYDEDKYSFDESCPLSESQLNVYLDENINSMGTAYNNPFKIAFKNRYSAGEIKNALIKLFEAFPVLKARVVNRDVLSLAFDANPEIRKGSIKDMDSFVKAFDTDKTLSRFLIVEDNESVILCADFHHLIFDGTSLNVLLDKFTSFLNGDEFNTDNGILRQTSFEESLDLIYMDNAQKFFDEMLADRDEVYELLPSKKTEKSESEFIDTFDIDVESLKEFMQNHSLTYNQFFASVFAYTLSRFAGSEKVLFNLVEDGRGHIDLSESVGMFVKTLPVLMDCRNQDTDSFFRYSSGLINSVMKYDLYPFRVLAKEYDLNSNIFFQYSHNLFSNVINNDYNYNISELDHDLVADLSFFIFNNDNRFTVRLLYSELYSESFVKHFVESFKLILHEITDVKELKDINYTSEDDIELLDLYNQTEHNLEYGDVLDAFNDNLAKNPNNKLISMEDRAYSYAESAYVANKIGEKLIEMGVNSDDCVAFITSRSEYYMFSVLGILSAGGSCVPLDDNLPDERLEFILTDTDSKVVIVSDETYNSAKTLTEDKNILLNISDIVNNEIGNLYHLPVIYGNLACVIYTSGTTGVPKGVKITRKAILNSSQHLVSEFKFTSDDVYGLYAAIGFDGAMLDIVNSFYAGGRLSVIPADIRLDMNKLNEYIVKENITHTMLTTQVGRLFVQSINDTTLKVLILGGERLGELQDSFSYHVIDAYGPTETFAYIASIKIEDKLDSSSVGHINYNTKCYILDNELRRMPVGAVGELYISGYQISEGYLNLEDENEKAFIDNPFDSEDYSKLYRSGDLVRLLPDGTLGIVGRRDSQVKIRGNRVELSEVESVIRELDCIKDVTVQVVGNGQLAAYVVETGKTDNIEHHICDYVIHHKPEYMVPSFVIKLDSIPLNVNGKVDRRALPEVDLGSLHEDYVAPTTQTEKVIAEAFEKVFGQENIGIYDDFIKLGGDSLTAIRLLSLLKDYNVSAADILSLRTPHAIANNINDVSLDLDIYSLDEGCPLNESQLNVYLDIASNDKSDSYLIPLFMDIASDYSIDSIINALNEIINAHPILGMCVSDEFDIPYLVKGSKPAITVESDVSDKHINKFLLEHFDLHDCLCRFLVVENDSGFKLYAVFHHIIFDAMSEAIFKKDLQSILDGKTVDADKSFLKVSAFSQQIQKSGEFVEAEDFFNSMLADSDSVGTLLDSVVPDGPGYSTISLDVDNKLFHSFLDKYNVSENILFSSVFAYTLSRFVGSKKVMFNIVENGRDRFSNYESIGMFVNTLPLLVDCKNQDIGSFMKYMSSMVYGVMRHNYYPFRLLANKFDINADILFQFIPDWIRDTNNFDDENDDLLNNFDDLIADLAFEIIQKGDNYILGVLYSDRYSGDFIGRFIESYKLILHGILNAQKLGDINYISNEDIKLLESLNQTEHNLEYGDVLDAFNDNLAKNPNNKLVSMEDRAYSYAESAYVANKIGEKLIEMGVNSDDCVAFITSRSEYYMFSVLGILSAGGSCVPLDDNLPDERLEFILTDTDSKVVIVSDETYNSAKTLTEDKNILLNISDIVNNEIGNLYHLPVIYGNLACVIYTSGTTGVPKGVKITRKAILNSSQHLVSEFKFTSDDVYGLYAAIGFDGAMLDIVNSFYAGGRLSVIPADIRLDMNKLNEYIVKENITHTMLTTQVGRLFVQSINDTTLKVLILGGERLGELQDSFSYHVIDAYGPTETFAYIASIKIEDKLDSSSVGHINYNTKCYILDNELRRMPVGAVGELYISGYQISEGYLNLEDENEKAFIDNPFDSEDYSKLYRSGDLVRLLPDGTLGIVGRRDSQVKIRGNRVELSEVESVIRELDCIKDVTVQVVGNGQLAAYVVETGKTDNIEHHICDYVIHHKPEYMVPSFVIKLDSIPLNVNGKVDRRALPEVDLGSLHEDYVAPTTQTEKVIAEAFEKVFGQENIGIYDDFIKLGGDSLTAIRLLSLLKDYNVSAADILSLRTPHAIANNINDVSLDLDIYSLDEGCPLNESQLNVYLDIASNDKSDSYLIPLFMDIASDYSIDSIINALNEIINAHPILGMCVSDEFDIPYLVKGSKPAITVESDVSDKHINKFLLEHFDLHDCLCRFLVVENDSGFKLFAVFHHIIFDALSEAIFKKDLQSILDGKTVDADKSFLKVSAFTQQIQKSDEFAEAEEFFNSMLADSDSAGVLPDSVRSDGPGYCAMNLDTDYKSFNSFLDKYNVSENILFSSAFAYTLSRFAGDSKVLFNIVENGRDRFSNYDSIGMFVNTLPLLVECKNQDIRSFMEHVSHRVYDVMRYNYYPFRLLANKFDINSDILFQFIPDWIRDTGNSDEFDNEKNDLLNKFDDLIADLIVEIIQKEDNYILSVSYSHRYSGEFIGRFIKTYKLILHGILNAQKLSEISYITKEDAELLDSLNQTEHDLEYGNVLDAFNHNLVKNSRNNLVSYGDVSYSYGEGAFIACEIAEKLKALSVDSTDCIGFLLPRSELYPFAVLGIMSMGAVYVPLDDALPDESIQFMLDDCEIKAVLVSDSTYRRAEKLINTNTVLLNISDIVKGEIKTLTSLPVKYNDLTCILYTSGTTGVPKGVKITRKSIVNVSQYYSDNYGLNNNDVFALFSAIGFDVSNFIIAAVLYSGSCLSVIPEDIRLNMVEMNNYFTTHGVTHAFLTTQIAKLFMESVSDISLDVLLVAGEKLGEVENPDNYELIDAYGPTEAFAFMSSINNRNKINPSSVGHLNYNTKAYVLDGENRRVPFGAVGELCISGYQIADGYLNREYETQKAFTENPFDDYPLLYRTGDMVRLLPDASIGIVGRRDSQVKIRGNRVELSEVEAAIREIDYIEDVTVHTIKNGDNNELVAYVVSDKTDNLKDSICDYVSTHKPDYIVPSFVIKLDSIPLNINGKVDRRALPEVDVSSLGEEYVPPSTEIEKKIVNAFEVVFNQKGIGLNDDFVRLGGDSITAIRLITLLEKESISCRATDILNYKTPYIIAKNVEKITKKSYAATEGEVDLLPVQSYFFDQLNTNDFSQKFILKSKTALDLKILQRAFDELTNIHDMLRATYKYRNDSVVQEILPLNTSVCQIKEYSTASLDKGIEKIIKESEMSLDIENQLIKFSLVHCDSEDYIVIVIHHLIVDGVSWSILIDDLTYIYNQIKKDGEINLLRPYPYKNWVENVKDLIEDISEDEKQHWAKINGLLDDTLIKGKSKGFYFNADALFNIDNQLMLKEEEYLALAISRAYKKTYREDIIFNRESYGRDESLAEVGGTVGWFTSQFPVLVDVNNEYDTISLMSDVYSIKNALNDVKHLGLNYGSLIYTTEELEYKHCPVTFNFLSTEFSYENELFVSVNKTEDSSDELQTVDLDSDSYGISLNVSRDGDSYTVGGDYADGTYLSDKFEEFVDNIKYELRFIGTYESDAIVCALSEPQLGIYLDEKVNEIGTAYSAAGILECGKHSIDEIKNAIHKLTDKHPVLLSRVVDGEVPLLYCDSYPSVDVVKSGDYSELIKSFDLNESLARFYIIEDNDSRFVFYDMHHIICDATSRTIINKELTLALNGELDDEVDLGFVHASRDSFDFKFDFSYDEAHEFYRGNLCDADDVSELMNDVDGSNNHIQLPIRDIRDNVEAFCREYGITVSNLFNAVFAYTYSRFTGSEKVYYTFTEHGRHKDYTQDALGMYVRTIPVIIDCKSRSVGEYLSYVSGLILDAMKYSVYPFRLLAHEFNLNKNVSFEYNADLNDIDIGDELVIKDSDIGLVSDFLCIVNDLADGYVVSVQSCDKYSDDTVTRFLNSFKEILIQILDKDNLSDINYTSESDLNILDSYNLTEHNLEYSDVLDAFNDNLAKYPDKTLVSFKDVSYTYAESAFIAYKLAERLIELGVTSNDCVSFMVERSELYMFSILGILSMGGVYVPLDDKLPDERIEFMINDTKSKVIIVSDGTYNRALNLAENCLILNISDIVNGEIKQLNSLNNNYGDLACILYTSGSTGLPKGVKITRKSIINFIDFHVHDLEILSDDVYGLFASIGFDVAMAAMFSVIYSGACLDVIPEDVRLNIRELNNHFIEYGVTHTYITTQIAKLFINQIEETSLKVLVAGGEKLGDIDVFRHYRIVDAYGPTEACVYVISATTIDKIDSSSVGHVHANTKAYVLDSEFRRVPIGAVGELYLSGSQLAKGYLNRDEETVKSFMNNPFESNSEYCELYCTGDVARVLPDGTYGIVGRRDSQVKIRGNRVELLEVESVIRNMDIISDVTVQTVNNDGNKELVAYVVLSNQEFCGNIRDIICDYVNELKPEYMIPSYVVRLESIPLNVNGKVDKRRLPEVDLDSLRKDYVGPRNKKEKEIVRAFEKVFDFDKISIYDDFIQLGGDSLTAVKLIQYIESNDVVTADILKLRTPEAIAKNMDDISFDLDIYSLESGCPLNASQINVFADVTLFNKVDAYQISNYIKIAKSYSLEDIVDALDRLLYAHPILSMILSDEYEVDKKNSVSTRQALEDLLRIAKKVGINEITKLIKSFGLRNLDGLYNMLKISIRFFKGEYPYLIKGPKPPISIHSNFDRDILIDFLSESLNFDSSLSKFMIMESDDSYYLFYMIHHIIFDATSQNVFKNNFWTLLDGGSVDLDDTFLRVSAFTHQIRKTEKFDEAKEFYESMLGDVGKAGHLPQDNSSKGYAISEYDMEFDKNALKSFLNNAEVSENILFTSVFSYALSKVVENYKVSFIMVENGRDRFSENFIDMTSNVMPLLVDCSDQSVGSFMENVSDIIYGSMKYSYYPLLMLYQKYDIQIKIMFQFLPNWISEEIEDIEEISSSEIMDYVFGSYNDFLADLFVQVTQNGDDYKLLIINSKKYSDKMINDFKNIYMSILSDIINADMSSDLSKLKKS